jgi:hypothetical protein
MRKPVTSTLLAVFLLCVGACSRTERTEQGPVTRTTTVYVMPAPPDGGGPPSPFTSPGASASAPPPGPVEPFTSAPGRFRVTPPGGVSEHPTMAGVVWDGRAASYSVLFYDGKPHGVDRSPLYTRARDHLGESAIDKEVDITFDGHKARTKVLHVSSSGGTVVYRRDVILVSGDRTYDVSVTGPDRARVEDAEAEAFFGSFHVIDD